MSRILTLPTYAYRDLPSRPLICDCDECRAGLSAEIQRRQARRVRRRRESGSVAAVCFLLLGVLLLPSLVGRWPMETLAVLAGVAVWALIARGVRRGNERF